MPLHHLVDGRQVHEPRRTDLDAVGLVGTVGDQVNPEFPLGMLHRGIDFPLGHAIALGKQLEMVDQGFHVVLHLFPPRRHDLVIVDDHRPRILAQPVHALFDDPVRLAHFLDPDEIAVVTVAVGADRDIEVEPVVNFVGLLLAQVPGHAGSAQHGAGETEL